MEKADFTHWTMVTLRNSFSCDNFEFAFPRFRALNFPSFQAGNRRCLEKVHQNATQIGNCEPSERIDTKPHNDSEAIGERFRLLSSLIWLGIVVFLASLPFIYLGALCSIVGSLAASSQNSLLVIWQLLDSQSRPIHNLPKNCALPKKPSPAQHSFPAAFPALLHNRNHQHKSKCVNWFRLKYASLNRLGCRCRVGAA